MSQEKTAQQAHPADTLRVRLMRVPLGGGADGFLEEGGVGVVAHDPAGLRVFGEAACGKEVLPDEFAGGVRVFAGEGVGEVDFAESVAEVGLVDALDGLDLTLEVGDEGVGEDGDAVVFAFAVADDDLVVAKVDVFDAQAEAFHQAQSASVEDFCHELGDVTPVIWLMTARASAWVRTVGRVLDFSARMMSAGTSISIWRTWR
nr:hypothetical protein [Roseiflexus sp.]